MLFHVLVFALLIVPSLGILKTPSLPCNTSITRPIRSDVLVGSGQTCTVTAHVNGTIYLDSGATLKTRGNVTVGERVVAYYADTVDLQGTTYLVDGLEVIGARKVTIGKWANAGSVYIRHTNLFLFQGKADHLRINGYGVTNVRIWGGSVLRKPNRFLQTGYFYAVNLRTIGIHGASMQVPINIVNVFGHAIVRKSTFTSQITVQRVRGPVAIYHNYLNWKKFKVLNSTGGVVMSSNKRFRAVVNGNRGSVIFQRNTVYRASFYENKKGTAIVDNWFGRGGIRCGGIFPWPWMRRNRFVVGAPKLGQCLKA